MPDRVGPIVPPRRASRRHAIGSLTQGDIGATHPTKAKSTMKRRIDWAETGEGLRAWFKLLLLLLDEIAVVFVVLFVLRQLGVHLPAGVLATIGVLAAAGVFLLHWMVLPALKDSAPSRADRMVGLEGEVVQPLSPEGVVRLRGELWKATTEGSSVPVGQRVMVTGREGLKLLVKLASHNEDS